MINRDRIADDEKIEHPRHYQQGRVEPIIAFDVLYAHVAEYYLATALAYLARAPHKGTVERNVEGALFNLSRAFLVLHPGCSHDVSEITYAPTGTTTAGAESIAHGLIAGIPDEFMPIATAIALITRGHIGDAFVSLRAYRNTLAAEAGAMGVGTPRDSDGPMMESADDPMRAAHVGAEQDGPESLNGRLARVEKLLAELAYNVRAPKVGARV
jgi:hypothetical protein